jgi:hypothetical protein
MSDSIGMDRAAAVEVQSEERGTTEGRKDLARWRRARRLADPTAADDDEATLAEYEADRPRVRGDCEGQTKRCIRASCRYNLFLDVNPKTGSIKFNFPGKEIWEVEHLCALDIADRGGMTLEAVGELLNLTRERSRQIEERVLAKIGHLVETGIPRALPEVEDSPNARLAPGKSGSLAWYRRALISVPVATDLQWDKNGNALCEWEVRGNGQEQCKRPPEDGATLCAEHRNLRAKMRLFSAAKRPLVRREVESIPSASDLGAA